MCFEELGGKRCHRGDLDRIIGEGHCQAILDVAVEPGSPFRSDTVPG